MEAIWLIYHSGHICFLGFKENFVVWKRQMAEADFLANVKFKENFVVWKQIKKKRERDNNNNNV